MADLSTVAAAVVIWVGFAYKAAEWRRDGDRSQLFFSLACLMAALALTVLNPWGYHVVDAFLGRPNIAQVWGDSFAGIAAWLALVFLHELRAGRVTAPLAGVYAVPLVVVLTIMWVAFVQAPAEPESIGFWSGRAGASPGPLPSLLAFLAYLGGSFGTIAVRGIGWLRVAQRRSIRVGLILATLGALLGIPFVLLEVVRVLLAGRLVIPDPEVLNGAACALMVVGTTFPSWATRAGFDEIDFSEWLALQRLFALWRLLRRAMPEIALPPEPSRIGSLVRLREAKWRLRRLVVETRDALLLLHVRWPDHHPSLSELEAELGLRRAADLQWLVAILAQQDMVEGALGLEDELASLRRLAAARPTGPERRLRGAGQDVQR